MSQSELLPCPFCGGVRLHISTNSVQPDDFHDAYVECDDCEAQGRHAMTADGWLSSKEESKEEAITAWNRRITPAAIASMKTKDEQSAATLTDEEILSEARFYFDVDAIGHSSVLAFARALLSSASQPKEPLKWKFTGVAGLKPYLTDAQYQAQTDATKKWYAPICSDCQGKSLAALCAEKEEAETRLAVSTLNEIAEPQKSSAASDAYDMIDRYLRNNLDDDDYSEYSAALDCVYAISQPAQSVDEREAIETAAKAIYRLFNGADVHPWVEGGNSFKQDEARRYARAALKGGNHG